MKIPANMTVFAAVAELQTAVAEAFCRLANESLRHSDRFCVSLSGGSTPQRIYELIAQCDLPWEQIHWFWGDERNVPAEDRDSNARMVRQALLDRIGAAESNIHAVPVDTTDPKSAALRYEQALRAWFPRVRFPRWDLTLLGMGDDAHTASLFPQTAALRESERWFVENWVEKLAAYRYTLTVPAINSSRNIWFVIAGESKRAALAQVLSAATAAADGESYPSQLIQPDRWFVTADTIGPSFC
jgi:6-phosphogluconolactonase